ncbi:MAG TPA: hypothetical protein VIM43_00745 [Rugosibacter sp.]
MREQTRILVRRQGGEKVILMRIMRAQHEQSPDFDHQPMITRFQQRAEAKALEYFKLFY